MDNKDRTLRVGDGQFDYNEYVRIETKLNKRKFHYTSFSWDEFELIVRHYKSKTGAEGRLPFALCQGVRNGAEIRTLSKLLGFRILGTDISDTILKVQDGILMDFHECPKFWFGKVDFLYSNSWDQSYDVASCIAHWGRLLSESGIMYLQHTPNHFNDTGIPVTALKELMSTSGMKCEETLAIPQSAGISILYRRIKKLFARLMGQFLPMSKPMQGTVVLVGTRHTAT